MHHIKSCANSGNDQVFVTSAIKEWNMTRTIATARAIGSQHQPKLGDFDDCQFLYT